MSVSAAGKEGGGISEADGVFERESPGRFLFAGAIYFNYDRAPRIYQGVKGGAAKDRNFVACLYKVGKNRLLMVFPFSSERLEIYELKR